MINQSTITKLTEMRLTAMADSYQEQLKDSKYQELSFDERLGLMVDIEWSRRKSNRLARLIKRADLRFSQACIEDIEYHADRKLDKTQILRLATSNYIQEKHNIIIMGAAGNGKTYIACALAVSACRNFFTVKYIRLPDLLNELAVARGEGVYQKLMKQYKSQPPDPGRMVTKAAEWNTGCGRSGNRRSQASNWINHLLLAVRSSWLACKYWPRYPG